jgi:hypothetical protein
MSDLTSTIHYIVFDIKYDIDDIDDIELPKKISIPVDINIAKDTDQLEEYLADQISNITGYCHFGFHYRK